MAEQIMHPMEINLNDVRPRAALRDWIWSQSADRAQIIVARAALRTLPILKYQAIDSLVLSAPSVFRAASISWAARSYPECDMSDSAFHAVRANFTFADDTGNAIDTIKRAVDAAARHETTASRVASMAVGSAVKDSTEAWICLDLDCRWIESQVDKKNASQRLTRRPLWNRGVGELFTEIWLEMSSQLLSIDHNYSVWVDWYERRIRGEGEAFDIPGDKHRVEDKKILRRLAEATDEDFWGKGHEYVNATLKSWLDEARARVAPPPEPDVVELAVVSVGESVATAGLEVIAKLPPQEPGAIAYGVNEQGKLDRLPSSDQVHLRDVPDQRRAYNDLRDAAAELLDEGQRLGHRLKRALERFVQSLPDQFEDAEAYPVWRDANALRRLHRAHREAAKRPEPDEAKLEPVVAEGLGGLLDLYNNFAFADDGLRAKDEARIAPQERASAEAEAKAAMPLVEAILANPEIATPEALNDIVADAENAELPVDDPYASQVLDQANRTWRNLVAGLISDTWAAFKNANPLMQGLVVNATYDGVTLATTVIGGVEYAPLLEFIAANPIALQHYAAIAFPSFEHLPSLIENLKLLWVKLRN
jgi:hypothetical protein